MLSRTSYEFHESLEPFSAFIRREWKPAAFFGGFFVVAALAVIFSVDPAFFYPRLQTDPLRYLMKAHAFIETGSTTVKAAVNIPPFLYAAMPGSDAHSADHCIQGFRRSVAGHSGDERHPRGDSSTDVRIHLFVEPAGKATLDDDRARFHVCGDRTVVGCEYSLSACRRALCCVYVGCVDNFAHTCYFAAATEIPADTHFSFHNSFCLRVSASASALR